MVDLHWLDGVIVLLALVAVGLYLHARAGLRAQLRARAAAEVQRQSSLGSDQRGARELRSEGLRLLRRVGSMLPLMNTAQRLEASKKLVQAGYRSSQALFVLMGISVLSMALGVLLVFLYGSRYLEGQGTLAWVGALLMGAYISNLLPRLVLDRLVIRRQNAIRAALPDALDLMVICTNAGLALNAALDRVAQELESVAPALADEFKYTAAELKISSDVERVMQGLAERTNLDSMRTLVSTFLQARRFGTAITQALRVLARSERTARMMRLEETAAKLAVKMTVPMMIFIMPTVLIIGGGPAIMNLMKFFSAQGG